ncbi:MAG: hypothetical protein R2831_01230 [Chitinophagaceae bacterium]
MKIIFFVLLLCKTLLVYSQDENLIQYYDLVYLAEKKIIQEEYHKADSIYQLAFSKSQAQAKDLYNTFLTAYYSQNEKRTLQMCKELGKKKFNIGFFQDSLFNLHLFQSILDTVNYYSKCSDIEMADTELIYLNETLYYNDQKIRHSENFEQLSDSIDQHNLNLLTQYITKKGYPSFYKVGYSFKYSSPFDYIHTFSLIFWHCRLRISDSIFNILRNELLNGHIPPITFQKMLIANDTKNAEWVFRPWMIPELDSAQISYTNAIRKKHLLDSLEDYYLKYQYQLKNDYTKFIFIDPWLKVANKKIIESGFYGN